MSIGIVPEMRSFFRPIVSIKDIPTKDPIQKQSEATPPRIRDVAGDIPRVLNIEEL